jgi:ribulose-phosphate 3-epimerase
MSRRDRFLCLRHSAPSVLPSLLLCDFANLQREVERLEEAGIQALHLDVMDGNFVPNLTYGMPLVASLRRVTALPLDVHLMIERPQRYIQGFHEAGADAITVHIEALEQPTEVLDEIRQLDIAAGIALNPGTPMSRLELCLGRCDLVLAMSVEAGFGGQPFNEVALSKLRQAREMFGEEVLLEIDGGVNRSTIGKCQAAGAQLLVVGSAIFKKPDYTAAVAELTRMAVGSQLQ